MNCQRCGKEFPSSYYFVVDGVCRECFAKLSPDEQAAARRPTGIAQMTTTAFTIDGYRIVETFGVVRGITVRSRSVVGTIGAALQTIAGRTEAGLELAQRGRFAFPAAARQRGSDYGWHRKNHRKRGRNN